MTHREEIRRRALQAAVTAAAAGKAATRPTPQHTPAGYGNISRIQPLFTIESGYLVTISCYKYRYGTVARVGFDAADRNNDGSINRVELRQLLESAARLGPYPIVTFQYSSTTLYHAGFLSYSVPALRK